jgi:hypothetical protein
VAGVVAVSPRKRRRRDQLVLLQLDPEVAQLLERLRARAGGRVGDEPKRRPRPAQPLDRLVRTGHQLPFHVEHAVEIEQDGVDALEVSHARS